MATESVTEQQHGIEREEGVDIGISGLMDILQRRTVNGGAGYNALGKLTSSELVTVSNQAHNVQTAVLNGLRVVGDLTSAFDTQACDFDHNGTGWLVKHLTETLEEMLDIQYSANSELSARGYDWLGRQLRMRA